MAEKYNIPLDEYPRRCIRQIEGWKKEYADMATAEKLEHSRILWAITLVLGFAYIVNYFITSGFNLGLNIVNMGDGTIKKVMVK